MHNDKPKSINGLMKYMRDEKHIKINGSSKKLQLRNMCYYHRHKGYLYINSPSGRYLDYLVWANSAISFPAQKLAPESKFLLASVYAQAMIQMGFYLRD